MKGHGFNGHWTQLIGESMPGRVSKGSTGGKVSSLISFTCVQLQVLQVLSSFFILSAKKGVFEKKKKMLNKGNHLNFFSYIMTIKFVMVHSLFRISNKMCTLAFHRKLVDVHWNCLRTLQKKKWIWFTSFID